MDYLQVSLTLQDESGIEAISNAFVEQGSGGVVIDDPQLIAGYANRGLWDDHEFSDELLAKTEVVVKGYLSKNEFLAGRVEALRQEIALICARLNQEVPQLYFDDVKEEDWANNWKVFFKPDKIGKFTVVKPTWEKYDKKDGELIIEIDPGMAFGTGNHATTALCINVLEDYIKPNMHVLDVGTGSGILAVLAALLGAEVEAMDFDTVAVSAALENVALNKLEDKVSVAHSDLLVAAKEKGDVIVANIVADIIIKLLPLTVDYLKNDKIFISSGIIDSRKDDVLKMYKECGFNVLEVREDKGWVCIVGQYKG